MSAEVAERSLEPLREWNAPSARRPGPVLGSGAAPPGAPPRLANARIALAMFLGAETMLFTGLAGAYFVLRQASPSWPPPGLPRLPIAVTWLNTAVLVLSCWTMLRARAAASAGDSRRLERSLVLTWLLGIAFLAVQGSEWTALILHGLRATTGVYGATFYVLIGTHALHVLGALLWLIAVFFVARSERFSVASANAVDLAAIYWTYVGALWLFLFAAVYLW